MDLTLAEIEIDLSNGRDTAIGLGDLAHFDDVAHRASPA
jgi:hypothetical protein